MNSDKVASELLKLAKELTSGFGLGKNDGPEPKFKRGDKVKTHSSGYSEVWSVGDYDEYLGDRRYVVMDPKTRHKLNFNEKSMSKIAKSVTAGSALEYLLTERDMMKLEDHVDEQTWNLAIEVYQKLKKDLELSSNQNEAINRLKRCTEQTSMPQAGLRNEIFKAAHALGIPLPSHFF